MRPLPHPLVCGALLTLAWTSPALPAASPLVGNRVEQPADDEFFARRGKAARQEAFTGKQRFMIEDLRRVMNRVEPLGLKPIPPASPPLSDEAFYRHAARATLALYTISEQDHEAGNGARLGTAFLVRENVIATCFHALKGLAEPFLAAAITLEGKPVRVTGILAVYPREDLAFLRVEGAGSACLPLRTDAPSGMSVRALGHPLNRYYFTVGGMIARYGYKAGSGSDKRVRMQLMIDSIGGFSGGAVMDAAGNAVGMIDSFDTIRAGDATYDVHSAIPAATILARFAEPYTPVMTPEDVEVILRVATGGEQTIDLHTIRSESDHGLAIAEVRSDHPRAFEIRIEDAAGNQIARGRPSKDMRDSLPPWAVELYDPTLESAEKKVREILEPEPPE